MDVVGPLQLNVKVFFTILSIWTQKPLEECNLNAVNSFVFLKVYKYQCCFELYIMLNLSNVILL